VNGATDGSDAIPLRIAQAVPSVQNVTYPKSIPIMLFFDDKIDLNTIRSNFKVTENGLDKGGLITINEAANGFAVLTFAPANGFSPNSEIVLTLSDGFNDDGGNSFESGLDYVLSFLTDGEPLGSFDDNGSFENGTDGVIFLGDGNILQGAQGCVSPTDGNSFAAITSGSQLVSGGDAIGDASSLMILGPISSGVSTVTFDYNFLSSEFQEFVDSIFDDSAVVTVLGDSGAYSEFLTSVNTVGTANNTQCDGFANMPDNGDDYSGETGWITKTINFDNVGDSAFIILTVTDVSDQIYSSALTLDNISFN
ncbi:MAG: Ig-like domain-containing protein, partial [Psychroserpens sp.]|nr:Ig-like domain-containing protein [Psychroserpens sp.]